MSEPTSPPPGFYDDPDNPGKERWWDGQQWSEISRDDETPATQNSAADVAGSLIEVVRENLPDAGSVAGGALIADGVVGFGRNRQGIFGALKGIIFGVVFVAISLFILQPMMGESGTVDNPVPVDATVVAVERVETTSTDSNGQTQTSDTTCTVTLAYSTQTGEEILAQTPYSSTTLCGRSEGEVVAIEYDADSPTTIQGLDTMGEALTKWFPWIFVGAGVLIIISSLWTLILRATQIGGGIYLINRSRQRDREKLARKAEKLSIVK